jgi:hypothetical protein
LRTVAVEAVEGGCNRMTLIKIGVILGHLLLGQIGVDWNQKAQETPWFWPDRDPSLFDSTRVSFEPYNVRLDHINDHFQNDEFNVSVLRNDEVLVVFRAHSQTVFELVKNVFIYAKFNPIDDGCDVIAFDLVSRKQIWTTHTDVEEMISHSRYSNRVNLYLPPGQDNVIVVYGKESAGDYVEYLDVQTGKVLGKKIFKPRT